MVGANIVRPHLSCLSNFPSATTLDLHIVWQPKNFSYNVLANFLLPQNRCRSLRIYVALRNKKAVQVYASMLVLFDVWVLCAFWICSAPLSRLTPIEALPQTPLGALPPDPHNGFHPLTLTRGVPLDLLLASLGVGYPTLFGYVIPHSSLKPLLT